MIKAIPLPVQWHSGISIYASEAMLKSASSEYGWIGGIDHSGKLRCAVPYIVLRKPVFKFIRFMEATIPLAGELGRDEETAFLNSLVEHFRSSGADLIIPGTNNAIFRTYPDGADAAPYGTYILDLTQPEAALWENLHSKHRNVIRGAMKKGVEVRRGIEHLDAAYALVKSTLERSGERFKGFETFKGLVRGLGQQVEIFVASSEGKVQGCAVIPFSNHAAHYLYGGSIAAPLSGSMNFLQWEMMRHFRGIGVRHYDFVGVRIEPEEGSKQDGIRRFKERFGGSLVQGYMWKFSFRPLKRILYSLAMRIRSGGDVVDKERHKLPRLQPSPAVATTG